MIDITKPVTKVTAYPSGRIAFKVLDKEVSGGLNGQYEAKHRPTNTDYIVHICRDRETNSFTGWAIPKKDCLPVLPKNAEIWNIYGKQDFQTMKLTGTVQRNSAKGVFMGSMVLRGTVGTDIVMQFVSGGGELTIIGKVASPLPKPAYTEA